MKKLMLAVAMVALIAAPAFAAVQNVKVSGDITSTLILDKNVTATGADLKGSDILTQTELNVEADLTDNVSTKIGLINERVWGNTAATVGGNTNVNDPAASTSVDLETAYVTLKEFLYSPLTLTVGRQPLVYGNSLIVGSNSFASNLPSAYNGFSKKGNFDAIKAVLSYNPLTIDLFASRIGNKATAVAAHGSNDNINLYGINANYKLGDKMSTVVEGYLFAKMDDTTMSTGVGVTNPIKSQDTYVPGLRVSTNPIEGLNVQLEGAYQAGHVKIGTTQMTRDAFAFQGGVNYALPVLKDMKPVLSANYKYLSGNRQTGDTVQKTGKNWDAMFENQDNGRIFDTLGLANSNVQLVKLSGEMTPIKDVTAALSWYGVWKAAKGQYVTNSSNASMYEGSEVDGDLTYAYTEDVKLGLSAGMFMTGKTSLASADKNATQILTSVSVAF